MTIEEVIRNLDGVRRVPGGYVALCPVHPDKTPSLSVRPGHKVNVLLRCFACDAPFREIMSAIEARAFGVRR